MKAQLWLKLITLPRLLGLCAIMVCMLSCENKQSDIDLVIDREQAQIDKAEGVRFIYSEHGKVIAELETKYFERNEQQKPPYMDLKGGISAIFYNDTLGVENKVYAKNARYYEEAGNVLIRDSVHIVTTKGDEMQTEELVWNQKIKQFYTDKAVTVKTATNIIYGQGLTASEDFSWYKIENIHGMVLVDKQKVD